jgi:hypothetical protein
LSSFWFVIKRKLTTKEISIFSNSSNFEWKAGLSDTILKGDHPRTIPAKFALIWFSGFRGEDLNVIFYQHMFNLYNRYKSVTKPGRDGPWEGPFHNYVWQSRPPFKMTAVTKNRHFFNCQFLLYYKSKWAQILTAATWQWVD